jgi:hypothetical protein
MTDEGLFTVHFKAIFWHSSGVTEESTEDVTVAGSESLN